MYRLMNWLSEYFSGVPDQLRRRKWTMWLLFVVLTAFLATGIGKIRFDSSIEGWFEKDDPLIVAFDWFHHEFGSDDHLYVVYRAKDGDVFSEASLGTLQALQRDLQTQIANARPDDGSAWNRVVKVSSLINARVMHAEDGALLSRQLVGNEAPVTSGDLAHIRSLAESQRSFPLQYFSRDHQYGGMIIETDFGAIPVDAPVSAANVSLDGLELEAPEVVDGPEQRPQFKPTDLAEYVQLMEAVKVVLDKPEYAGQFEYYPVGSTAAAEYNVAMVSEMGMLNMIALGVIICLLWFLFRSASAVVWPVAIIILSLLWTLGIVGWLGWPVTAFVMVVVMLTLALGVADTVHIMSAYLSARREGLEHTAALRKGFRHVAVACLLTTIANVVAVVALSVTPIIPIRIFSFMCVLGVSLPLFFTIYLFPLMLDFWAPKVAPEDDAGARPATRLLPNAVTLLSRLLTRVLPFVEKRPVAIITVFAAFFVVCVAGALRTQVDTDPVASFPADAPIRQSVQVVDQNMMGAQSMEVYLDLGKINAFHDPLVLGAMERMQQRLEQEYPDVVVRTTSIVNTVKESYQTLNEGREDMYRLPSSVEAVSQTLFLFNQSNPEDRRRLVSDNYDKARISVRLYNRGSYEYTRTWEAMQVDINAMAAEISQAYPESSVAITGMLPLMMQGADELTTSELESFMLALVLVSILLLLMFGTLKSGVIALVPNLIPALFAYGAMGLLGRPLDITTMMIAPIIIGIAIDDTVHFLTHYRAQYERLGDIRKALETTIEHAGQAVVFTTLVLGLGFGVMAFADDAGAANLGTFGFGAILLGLFNDLLLLPALILVFKLTFPRSKTTAASDASAPLPAVDSHS